MKRRHDPPASENTGLRAFPRLARWLGLTRLWDWLMGPKPALPSRKARIPARVSFDSQASGTATLVEIVAEDRPGLLYDLASAISSSGGNIEVVLIDTQAHKAIDVFYVTASGKKLALEKQQALGAALDAVCPADGAWCTARGRRSYGRSRP